MSGLTSGAQTARSPYALIVTVNACRCHVAPTSMGTARSVDRLVPWAQGYWDIYMGFWGHLPRFIAVSIVDTRDGAVMWRNGKHLLQEDEHGNKTEHPSPGEYPRPVRPNRGRIPGGRPGRTRGYGA